MLFGWLHVIWADPLVGSGAEPGPRYVLIDDQERRTEVVLDEDRLRPLGGLLALSQIFSSVLSLEMNKGQNHNIS